MFVELSVWGLKFTKNPPEWRRPNRSHSKCVKLETRSVFLLWGGWGGLEVLRHRAGQDRRSVPKDSYGPLPMSTKLMAYLIAPFRRTHPHLLIRVMWGGNQRAGGPILRPVSIDVLSRVSVDPKVEVDTPRKATTTSSSHQPW